MSHLGQAGASNAEGNDDLGENAHGLSQVEPDDLQR